MTTDHLFSVDAVHSDGSLRVTVKGELDMSTEAELVELFSSALTSDRVAGAVLELTSVTFIDSSGLRALLRCRDAATAQDVPFALAVGENPQVKRLLDIAGVEGWFTYE
jgi:anti-sigma B factor antagonist